jgi:hypothetical protein
MVRPSAALVGAWVAMTAPASVAATSAKMRSMHSLLGGGRAPHGTSATAGPGLGEALAAWAAFGVVGAGIWVTYARLPASELYNVSGTGFLAGASRTLVFLNWPVALAAVALATVAAERLLANPVTRPARIGTAAALVTSVALCATVGLPGVLDPNDLDARPANVPAALGALVALVLTVAAVRRCGAGPLEPFTRGDWLALATVPLLLALSIPWILAGVGVSTGEVPLLDQVYVSVAAPADASEPAVHLGNHEGIDGILLAATAFGLRRPLRRMRPTLLRPLTGAYLALIATYGLAVAADDFWIEQLQKRGMVEHWLPYVLKPGPRPAWAALVAVACAVYVVAFRVGNEPGSPTARR